MDSFTPIPLMNAVQHGGDPAALEARFGVPEHGWLDLSTGINPRPYAPPSMPTQVMARLPLKAELDALLAAARQAYGVPDGAAIVAAPGTQALIQHVPTLFAPADVTVLGPTYGEHAPAWAAAGHRVEEVASICAQAARPAPFAVLVHPNNPDGRLQSVEGLLAFADELHDRGGALVVDEAFIDVNPARSVTSLAGRDGLIVLRSFGKFYGLAGIRLGFAVCAPDMAERLNAKLGPWAVSGPAIWVGMHALNDTTWAEQTRTRLKADAARLDALLLKAGLGVVGGTDLFRLVESEQAPALYEILGCAGILTRPFVYNARWLRFGLPGREEDWARLQAALAEVGG